MIRVNLAFDAAKIACQIERVLDHVPDEIADRAAEFVWFYRVGQHFNWMRSRITPKERKKT